MEDGSCPCGHVGGLPEILTGEHFTQYLAPGKHSVIFFFFLNILFIFLRSHWIFVAVHGLLIAVSSLGRSMGSRCLRASVVASRGLSSCSCCIGLAAAACGILPGIRPVSPYCSRWTPSTVPSGSRQSLLMTITVALLVFAPSL